MDLLCSSDSDSGNVKAIRAQDEGSKPCCASARSASLWYCRNCNQYHNHGREILQEGGDCSNVGCLKKKNLKPADKIPKAYD